MKKIVFDSFLVGWVCGLAYMLLLVSLFSCDPGTAQVQPPLVNHHHNYKFEISGGAPQVYFSDSIAIPDEIRISGASPVVYIGDSSISLGPGGWHIKRLARDTIIVDRTRDDGWVTDGDSLFYVANGDTLVKSRP